VKVGVRLSAEGSRQRWCGFNASVSALEERRWVEALPEDEADAASSSWFHVKEA
jgi:hypothetical protein